MKYPGPPWGHMAIKRSLVDFTRPKCIGLLIIHERAIVNVYKLFDIVLAHLSCDSLILLS